MPCVCVKRNCDLESITVEKYAGCMSVRVHQENVTLNYLGL